MKKRKSHFAHELGDVLQIPRDLAYQDAILTMIGSQELYLENYKSIVEYENHCILIQTKNHRVKIEGSSLQIEYYTRDEMKIIGNIHQVSYLS